MSAYLKTHITKSKLERRNNTCVCVLKKSWGCGIGNILLTQSIAWADTNNIKKITLNVLESNTTAIELYERFGFEIEGVLKNDKILSDGKFYNTILMGRFNND